MNGELIFMDYHKCVGCGTCEMVCSLVHEGKCSPALSRIRVVRQQVEGRNVPVTCAFCENAPCAAVCPSGAIVKNKASGMVSIREQLCIGCHQCVQACPFGHMNFNSGKGVAFKCDLCGGDPQCVKFCWTGAVEFLRPDLGMEMKRSLAARKMMTELT